MNILDSGLFHAVLAGCLIAHSTLRFMDGEWIWGIVAGTFAGLCLVIAYAKIILGQ